MTDAQIEEFKRALAAGPVRFTYLKTLKDARGRTVKDAQGNPEFEEESHMAIGTLNPEILDIEREEKEIAKRLLAKPEDQQLEAAIEAERKVRAKRRLPDSMILIYNL